METSIEQISTTGQLQLTIQVSANVNYSAAAARRIVGRFVADEIGYLLRASEPTLVVSDRVRWRVPVTLAYPGHGVVGAAGTLDVDVETGQAVRAKTRQFPSLGKMRSEIYGIVDELKRELYSKPVKHIN